MKGIFLGVIHMKLISATVGVIILLYLSIKHSHNDFFNNQEEIHGAGEKMNDQIKEN